MSWDTIESICSIPGDGEDELWVAVDRVNGRFIERMEKRVTPVSVDGEMAMRVQDQFYVDSHVSYNASATTNFSGLSHLEGLTVSILADGVVKAQDVVDNGWITLTASATVVSIGLPYYSDFETLNIEVPANQTAQGRKVKIGNLIFRLVDTRGGWVGPDSSTLYEAFPERISELVGNDTDFYTGDIRMPLGGEYSNGGRIFYRQVDPIPVTITAVIPETFISGQAG